MNPSDSSAVRLNRIIAVTRFQVLSVLGLMGSGVNQAGGGSPEKVEVKQRNHAFDLSGKSNVTIKNLRVFAAAITTDSSSTNITLDGLRAQYVSHFVTVHGLASHRNGTGLRLMGANNVIRNSVVEYSAGVGIALGGADALAENNLVHDISYGGTYGCGIWPAPGGARQTIVHNTIFRTGRSGIDGVYRNKDIGCNDMTAGTDPRFVNEGEGGLKYRLQPNSPAIDRGAAIPGVTDGYVGSAPDVGAYEYGGTDWVAGCTINPQSR